MNSASIKPAEFAYRAGCEAIAAGDLEQAATWLDRSLEESRPPIWSFYERGRVQHLRGDYVGAAGYLQSFLSMWQSEQHGCLDQDRCRFITETAHECYKVDRGAAASIYCAINTAGFATQLVELRLIEAMLNRGALEAARDAMTALRKRVQLNAAGWFIQARIYNLSGEVDATWAAVLQVIDDNPADTRLHILACGHLLNFHQPEIAKRVRGALPATSDPHLLKELADLDERLFIQSSSPNIVLELLTSEKASELSERSLIELLARVASLTPGDQGISKIVAKATSVLAARRPYSLLAAQSILAAHMREWAWDAAFALLEALRAEGRFFNHPSILLRRFHIACLTLNLETARSIYDDTFAGRPLEPAARTLVLGFLAEIGRWDEAAARLVELVGMRWSEPATYHTMLAICRKTNCHKKLLAQLDGLLCAGEDEAASRLRAVIADDLYMALVNDHRSQNGRPGSLSARNALLAKPFVSCVNSLDCMGYMCVDSRYMLGAMTFLASYAMHNPARQSSLAWTIFLSSDVPALAAATLAEFAAKLGLPLTLADASDISQPATGFRDKFDLFTAGSRLSAAAYLRIYAARALLRTRRLGRVFYLDSDTLCHGKIDDFLDYDFGGALLLARRDVASPPVQAAEDRHALRRGSYFNSGVMQFDAERVEIGGCLDHAILLAETAQERLMFVDQCALNIAFADQSAVLPARFNHFMAPWLPPGEPFSDATFLHYVARPKPWETACWREDLRAPWLQHLATVRVLLPAAAYNLVVAAANGAPASEPRSEEAR